MNMKKTIAAVAACAVAVSAMATVVSAEDTREQKESHNYSLVKAKWVTGVVSNLTFEAKDIAGATASTPYVLDVYAKGCDLTNQVVKVAVTNKSTKTTTTFEFKTDKSAAGYDGYAEAMTSDLYGVKADGTLADQSTSPAETIVKYVPDDKATGGTLETAYAATPTKFKKIEKTAGEAANHIKITIPETSTIFNAFKGTPAGATASDTGIDITVTLENLMSVYTYQEELNIALGNVTGYDGIKAGKIGIKALDTGAQSTVYSKGSMAAYAEVKQPFFTTSNMSNTAYGAEDIFERLDEKYVNVKAVVNDMIANYDDVTFTFHTATDNVLTAASVAGKNNVIQSYKGYYVTGVPGVGANDGDSTFKAFPQHLYNLYGTEGTQYTYTSDPVFEFNNLFNAALVANNGITMNQSAIQPFEYNATSVSFSWLELTGGANFASHANTLYSLQLMTSSDWYWDSMDVTGYAISAEDVNAEAGVTDEGEDLDDTDTDVDDTDIDDTDVDDTDIDDTDVDDVDDTDVDDTTVDDVDDVDDTTVDDTAADETQGNPDTGNAPIALAVIPVALAAAAVVAKKRG